MTADLLRRSDRLKSLAAFAGAATLARSDGVAWSDLAEQPSLRGLPVPHDCLRRYVQDICCFLDAQAAKEPQLHDLAHTRIERRQCAERIAEGDEVSILRVRQLLHVIETHMNRTATTFLTLPVASELHEDPSHHLRRDSEEVRSIPPFDSIDVDQPQVRLVHQ